MISKFFLERPVFAWVVAIFIMLLGGMAIYTLPVAQYPDLAPPSIAITANYPGASAETVENSVTQLIEQNLTGLDGMLYLSSTSDSAGESRIEVVFRAGPIPISPGPRCKTASSLRWPVCRKLCSAPVSRSKNPPETI